MHKNENCRNGCIYAQDKDQLWQAIVDGRDGCCINLLVEMTGLSLERVESLLEDLYVEEKVFFHRRSGKWHLENLPVH